jgi:hypothetical protein
VAAHNLAVLAHTHALDLELAPRQLHPDEATTRDKLWPEALRHWKEVVEDDRFWDALHGRIVSMNEPQLRDFDLRGLRAELPRSLLGINAQLAVRAAQQGRADDAGRHKEIMLASGLGHDAVSGALRHVLRRVHEQLRKLFRAAATDAQIENWGAAMKLVAQVQGLLLDTDGREFLLDEIADIQAKLCWFCLRRQGDVGSAIRVWLHGDVARKNTTDGREVHWKYVTIDVPRCRSCYEDHRTWEFRKSRNWIAPDVRPEREKLLYPQVSNMAKEGWQMGSRPPGV